MTVTLRQAASAVGIQVYPQELEAFYDPAPTQPACDLEQIRYLQDKYNVFAEFFDEVSESARMINQDPAYSAWVRTASAFFLQSNGQQLNTLPASADWEKPEARWLLLHIMIPQIVKSIVLYRNCGLTPEQIKEQLSAYAKNIRIVKRNNGIAGLDKGYYSWLCLYAKAMIFCCGGLEFEIRNLPVSACLLQNRQTGELRMLRCTGLIHRSGLLPVGAFGYEDDTDSFEVSFAEDDVAFYGHGIYNNVISAKRETFPKTRWISIAGPGDPCLSLHIPAGADISNDALDSAFAEAWEILRQGYPEHKAKVVFCNSWLLDPKFEKLLNANSKIVSFMKRFTKFPQKDNGKSALNFVFGKHESLEDLPENTSLGRKLKALYLGGGCIHAYCGIIPYMI